MDFATGTTASPLIQALAAMSALTSAVLARKWWVSSCQKDCQQLFGFSPQKPLTSEQISTLEHKVYVRSLEYHEMARAKDRMADQKRFEESGRFNHDVEYAAACRDSAIKAAMRVASRYAPDPIVALHRIELADQAAA